MQRLAFLMLAALAVITAGCASGGGGILEPAPSRLRVIHASPNAPAVDVVVDRATVFSSLDYKAVSPYVTTIAGTRNIRVEPAGTNTAVIEANVTLAPASSTTIIAVDRVARIAPLVLTDDNTSLSGNARVRFVHASPAAGNVDIYVTAPGVDITPLTPQLRNIPFKAVSGYLAVPSGNYQVRITPTGTKTVVIDTGAIALAGGRVFTAVALGDPDSDQPFEALLTQDN